jgi:hypothetical protein
MRTVHLNICAGVTDTMTCRFNGACYGEICIAPRICKKNKSELTDDDRAVIARSAEMDRRQE